jgi:hypothetical protein
MKTMKQLPRIIATLLLILVLAVLFIGRGFPC